MIFISYFGIKNTLFQTPKSLCLRPDERQMNEYESADNVPHVWV